MAGGTFTTQNKVRAGVYIRFRSASNPGLSIGDRGVVAICEPMDWGAVGTVQTVEAGTDVSTITGYDITNTKNRFLQEIFRGSNRTTAAQTVLLYRPSASGSASASAVIGGLTVTAAYPGVRGNDITVIVSAVSGTDDYVVTTVVGSDIVDQQTVSAIDALENNAWVTFTGTGALAETTGVALTGGENGTVTSAAYTAFMSVIEAYKFDVLCYDGSDSTVISTLESFVKRIAEENGQYAQLVCSSASAPDSRFVINVQSGVVLEDGTTLTAPQTCWWVAGVEAGAHFNESLTFAKHPAAVSVTPVLTNSQIINALSAGQLVLNSDDGSVKIESDINSLTTYTSDIGKVYRKNRVMRLCNSIANDIYREFSENFIGVVNNNDAGRSRFKSVIVGYLLSVQAAEGIQNFTPDDVEVLQGVDADSVVINLAIQVVDSAEKIYMTVEVA